MMKGIPTGALVALLAAACVSDRQTVTLPQEGEDCRVPAAAVGADRVVVLVRGFVFSPDTLRIRPGTTVTWVNCEPPTIEPHTTTADGGFWDSGPFAGGDSFAYTFDARGSFGYFCRPHPFMRGTVLVD
jgi:plastocyanin